MQLLVFWTKFSAQHIPLLAEEGCPRHQKPKDPFRFVADGVVSSARLRRPAELTTAFVASRHFLDGAATFEASPYRARAPRPPLRGEEYDAFKFCPNGNIIDIWLRRSRAVPLWLLLQRSPALSRRLARDHRLRRCQSRDRHTVRRTAHIVESHLITKLDRWGIAAVLAADSDFELRTGGPALLHAGPHKRPNTFTIQFLERVGLEDSLRHVVGDDLTRIIARETESRLSQVIGSE